MPLRDGIRPAWRRPGRAEPKAEPGAGRDPASSGRKKVLAAPPLPTATSAGTGRPIRASIRAAAVASSGSRCTRWVAGAATAAAARHRRFRHPHRRLPGLAVARRDQPP
jgi:hypothetical protein